eukprot:6198375-Pleurochrysis_carterae.AAC.1
MRRRSRTTLTTSECACSRAVPTASPSCSAGGRTLYGIEKAFTSFVRMRGLQDCLRVPRRAPCA